MSESWKNPDSGRIELVCPTSLEQTSVPHLPCVHSGVKHLEEIKIAGHEMPSVNQIEVPSNLYYNVIEPCSCQIGRRTKAPSVLPAKAYRLVLSPELDCHPGLLPRDTWKNGSPCHPRSGQ